jgi:hypothetical protein
MGRQRGLDRWVVAVVVVGGCIPAPVLRVRDGAAEASADAADAARDEDSSALDAPEVGVDVADVVGADVVDVPAPQDVFDAGAPADVTDAGAVFTDHVDATTDLGSCDPGFALRGGACVAVTTARPLWPMSTQTATHRRPLLRWRLGAESDGARVELCRDRACTTVVTSFVATGTQGQPALDLPPGPLFWRVWSRAGGAEALRPSVSWQVYVPWRSGMVNTAQRDTVDVNGDGYADVVVAVPERREVRVYFGSAMGPRPAMVMTDPFIDPAAMALSRAGDTNGDGRTDLIVRYGLTSWRVLYGTTGGYSADLRAEPATNADADAAVLLGSMESIGDVNGDGFSDIAWAETTLPRFAARAAAFLGSNAGTPSSPSETRSFAAATSLRAMGDLDGDGFEDVVTNGYATPDAGVGSVCVYRGGGVDRWGLLGAPAMVSVETFRVWGRIDFDGDGLPDAISRGLFAAERLPLYLGSRAGLETATQFVSPMDGSRSGSFCIADFNGDGVADVMIEAGTAGQLRVFLGTTSGLASTPAAQIPVSAFQRGTAVASPGDINGDGFGDAVVFQSTESGTSLRTIYGASTPGTLALSAAFAEGPARTLSD